MRVASFESYCCQLFIEAILASQRCFYPSNGGQFWIDEIIDLRQLIPKFLQTNRIHLAKNIEKSLHFGKSRAKNGLIRLLRPKNLVYSTINAKSPNTGHVCFFMGTICGHSRVNVHCPWKFINPGRKFMHPPVRQHRLYAEIHGNLDRGL